MQQSMDFEVNEKEPTICLIDGDSLIYYEMGKATLEEAIAGLDSRVVEILSMCNTNRYAGFLTATGNKCFRYAVSPSYKDKRKHTPKPPMFYALREHMKQLWKFTEMDLLEADDLVSYHGRKLAMESIPNIICSPDKDVLKQCEGVHYNYQKKIFITTSNVEAVRFLWKQVLMGDTTDGIKGLPGVGEKTSENWVKGREKDFASFVLKKYQEEFGEIQGLKEFSDTFKLAYLLKTDYDMELVLGTEPLPTLTVEMFNFNSTTTDDTVADDLWGNYSNPD